jgi:hypothetical protein
MFGSGAMKIYAMEGLRAKIPSHALKSEARREMIELEIPTW